MPPVFLKSAGLLVHLHHVIAGVDIAGSNHIHAGKIIGVGNNGDNHRRVARCLDLIQVHRQQPLLILLAGQTLLMFVFTNFIVFRVMGRDYDAAVISSGVCGFGMGATPNAMANMQALCEKYAPSVKAYLLIPLVGSLFADFINSLVTTFFINFI